MTIDRYVLFDGCLIGAVSYLGWLAWQLRSQMRSLRTLVDARGWEVWNRVSVLEQLTSFDALTGMGNQRMFESTLATALRGSTKLALLYIDLDGLKPLNASLGHQGADKVIRSAALAIRSSLRRKADRDNVFRRSTAADEFFIVLANASLETGILVAEQCLTSLRSLPIPVTASIGVVTWDGRSPASTEDLERAAELEMEQAKADGRGCVRPLLTNQRSDDAVPNAINPDRAARHTLAA